MTSLTRTDTARSPSGMAGGRPPPPSFAASFIGRIGSFSTTGEMSPRPTTSSTVLNAPVGTEAAGHSIALTSSLVRSAPTSRFAFETTTCLSGIEAGCTCAFWM